MNIFILTIRYFLLSFLLLLFVHGCVESKTSDSEDTKDKVAFVHPRDFPFENLSDSEFYKEPRVQLVWLMTDGSKLEYLVSMKLDGSDKRRVIESNKILYGKETGFRHKPVRSPNRRYLAYAASPDKGFSTRNIIDLKTNEITKLNIGAVIPDFCWSPNSEYLFFVTDFDLYRFHLPTKKLVNLGDVINAAGLFALPDNKTLVAVIKEGIGYYDYDGKEIKKYDLGLSKYSKVVFDITKDGKYFFFRGYDPEKLYDISGKPTVIKEIPRNRGFSGETIFIGNNLTLNRSYYGISIYDLFMNETTDLVDSDGNVLSKYTLMN